MVLTPAQKQIVEDNHRFRVVNCGRRFGKTTLATQEMIGKASAVGNRRVTYFAPTRDQARELVWQELLRICGSGIHNKNETLLQLIIRSQDGGLSTISLFGWESVERARGLKNDMIVLDEVSSYRNFWANWQEILRPTLIDTKGDGLFLSTPKGFNHFHALFKKELEDTDFKSFHFTSYDNPHLKVQEIEKAKLETPEDRFAQEYLADFRKIEGLIWNIEDDAVLAPSPLIDKVKTYSDTVIAGVDWGFHNPTGIVVAYVKDAVFYVLDEWKKAGCLQSEIIEKCKEMERKHKIRMWYPDPAEPDRVEEMKRAGLHIGDVNKDVPFGLSLVASQLHSKRLFISQECQELLSEADQYQFERALDGRPEKETPVKVNDHLCDALRYLVVGHRPVDPIKFRMNDLTLRQRALRKDRGFE